MPQTTFSALVKLLVRELRLTEQTHVIVLYLGTVSTIGAAVACTVLPGGFVVPTRAPQVSYLVGAGPRSPARQTCAATKHHPVLLQWLLHASSCIFERQRARCVGFRSGTGIVGCVMQMRPDACRVCAVQGSLAMRLR